MREIVAYAIANCEMDFDPARGVNALPPNPERTPHQPDVKRKFIFDYPLCAQVAKDLHVHHYVTLWVQRVLGLRIGEVFGIHVDDIGDFGDVGIVVIGRQGGGSHLKYGPHGEIVECDEIEKGKTAAASRVLAIPLPLLELLRVYIAAFHTDPATGEVQYSARLIMGLREPNRSGASSYRTALNGAFAARGLTYDELGFNASTHHLRASLGGDLKHQLGVDEMIRSEVLGHRIGPQGGGAAITAQSYTPSMPQLESFIAVAKVQGPLIVEKVESLISPIDLPHPMGHIPYLPPERVAHARSVLEGAGIIGGDREMITMTEAINLLGEGRKVITRAIRLGRIQPLSIEPPSGGPITMVRLDEVLALKLERQSGGDYVSTEEAAQLLAISQWSLVRLIQLGSIRGSKGENNRYLVSRTDVEVRRESLLRLAALQARAVRVGEAAAKLRLSTAATKRLLKAGRLEADAESHLDPVGGYYITLASIEAYRADMAARSTRARRSATLPDDWIPLEDVIAGSGQNRVGLLALSGKGLIIKRDLKYKFFVHRESPLLTPLLEGED